MKTGKNGENTIAGKYERVEQVDRFVITQKTFIRLQQVGSEKILIPPKILDRFCIEVSFGEEDRLGKKEIYISYIDNNTKAMLSFYFNEKLVLKVLANVFDMETEINADFYNEYFYLSKMEKEQYLVSIMKIWDIVATFVVKYKELLYKEVICVEDNKRKKSRKKTKKVNIYFFPLYTEFNDKSNKISLNHEGKTFVEEYKRIVNGKKQIVRAHFR
ncbi:MAG: hypothetical protein RSE00_00060 [Clostridia bacterium]